MTEAKFPVPGKYTVVAKSEAAQHACLSCTQLSHVSHMTDFCASPSAMSQAVTLPVPPAISRSHAAKFHGFRYGDMAYINCMFIHCAACFGFDCCPCARWTEQTGLTSRAFADCRNRRCVALVPGQFAIHISSDCTVQLGPNMQRLTCDSGAAA